MRAYDAEESAGLGLTDLAEDSDDEPQRNGKSNGSKHYEHDIELENRSRADN